MRRIAALTLALAPLSYSAVALFYGWLTWGMQCDEICRTDSSDWRYTRDAWQWSALGLLGLLAFVAGIAFFISIVRRHPVLGLVCLLIGAGAVFVGLALLTVNPGSDMPLDFEPIFYVVSAAVLAAGVAAIALAQRPTTAETG